MYCLWGCGSVGERSVRIRKVEGSNPFISMYASVAQWIEHRIPVPGARVRLLSDAFFYVCEDYRLSNREDSRAAFCMFAY